MLVRVELASEAALKGAIIEVMVLVLLELVQRTWSVCWHSSCSCTRQRRWRRQRWCITGSRTPKLDLREWETSSTLCSWILALERFSSNILHTFGKVSQQRKKMNRLFLSLLPEQKTIRLLRQESFIENHNDVRSSVVAEVEFQASWYQQFPIRKSGSVRKRSSPVKASFYIRGVGGAQTQVVRGGWHVALGQVAGIKGEEDVHAMMGGNRGGSCIIAVHSWYYSELHCVQGVPPK